MRKWLIEKLGGFSSVEQALDTAKGRNMVLTEVVRDSFNTIGKDDIFRLNDKGLYTFMGKELTPVQVDGIRKEIEVFKLMFLYKILDAECKYQANKMMFETATTEIHLASGKLLIYLWDIIKTKLNQF